MNKTVGSQYTLWCTLGTPSP